jgi:tetratricopeptide (TPR) repeat protein
LSHTIPHPIIANYTFPPEHDLKPSDVTLLARILLRTSHTTTARDLLLAAAKLRDEPAIFLVIQEALRRGSLGAPGVDFIYRTTFKILVEKSHPKALYLEAQLCERQGNNDRALALYEKLVARDTEDASSENDVDYGTAWMAISKLRARKGDRAGVGKAIERAAFRFENPAAYYQLAKVFTSPSTAEYEGFLLKAAASGEVRAAHELGVLYFSQSQGRVPVDDRGASNTKVVGVKGKTGEETRGREEMLAVDSKAAIEKRKLARQWFALGADAGLTGSQVYLAALLHKLGKLEEGLKWLQAARNSKDSQTWVKVINHLREHWDLADSDFSHVDIEGIR